LGAPPLGGDPPLGGLPPPAAAPRSLRHLLSALLNAVLLVLMPLVLNTGPLPEVFAAGRSTPFSRMQAVNFASVLLEFAPPKRAAPAAPPAGKFPPPHFFNAACSCAELSPLGSLDPPPGLWPGVPVGGDGPGLPPAGAEGSVTPCLDRHSRSAVDLAEPAPGALLGVVADLLFAELVLPPLPEELPHAASIRQAPRTSRARTGRVWRRLGG
jgi:hypothetical protein